MFQPAENTAESAVAADRLLRGAGRFLLCVVKRERKQADGGGKGRIVKNVRKIGNIFRTSEANLFVKHHGRNFANAGKLAAAAG